VRPENCELKNRMVKEAFNYKRVVFAVVLLTTFPFCLGSFGQSQEQKAPQKSRPKEAAKKEATDEKVKKDEERTKQAQSMIEGILYDTHSILNPVVRIRIRMLVAEAYWVFQPEKAREILSEEFPKIALIAAPQNESDFGRLWSIKDSGKPPMYKGRPIDQVKAQLRREMLAIVSARDSTLARALVAAEKTREKESDRHTEETDEVLATVNSLAETDPEAAARLLKESLKTGVSEDLAFLLIRLRDASPAEASAIFNQVFSAVRASGDLWEFQRLLPYILPTELERLVGGKNYLTDSQRMKDANAMIQYAAELLYHRIQTGVPANVAPELVRREYYIWRNLLSLFNDLKPESVWLVNIRLRQLTAVLTQPAQGVPQGPWSEERLNQLIAAADASSGDKRDENLNNAAYQAWRFGQGDLDQAISLAEKIGNAERRQLTMGTLYFQAGLKYLRSEGPDYVLGLAKKIDVPGYRVRLYLAIIGTLSAVKASERTEVLREELLNWLRNCDKTSETAWAVLEYLDGSVNDNAERNFEAFDILVRVLNSPNLDPDNKLKNRVYWYAEFHDFRKSLTPLAKADFERGLQVIQMLNNKEISMQIQAAFFVDYLKMRNKSTKALPTVASKSEP